jgi:hypothetical protein
LPASDILTTQLALADLRTRVLAGETLAADEFHLVLNDLRRDRDSASRAGARARREAARAAPKPASPLLDNLFGAS